MILHDPQQVMRDELERVLERGLVGAWYCLGVGDANGLKGVLAFDDIGGGSCEMHAAGSPGFLSRALLREAGRVMFGVLQLHRVTIRCSASNLALQAAAERCGFKREGLMRRFYGDEDAAILGLLSTEYRFHGQEERPQDRRAA